jgi:glucose-1-phosphate cytidylyltransferase
MKVVILAGGLGTRLTEETTIRPKPMIEIGGTAYFMAYHETLRTYGYNEFIICLGYTGHIIKEYFITYYLYNSDISIELNSSKWQIHIRIPKSQGYIS